MASDMQTKQSLSPCPLLPALGMTCGADKAKLGGGHARGFFAEDAKPDRLSTSLALLTWRWSFPIPQHMNCR